MVNWGFDGDVDTILLTDENVADNFKKCVLDGFVDGGSEFSGGIGTRIGSIFVILVTSTFVTLLPILTTKFKFKVPLYFYLAARYFGAGVIIATAFIHLMDPAYGAIGPDTCIGGWGNWAVYSWPPALMLLAVFMIFLTELFSQVYVERKYGKCVHVEPNVEKLITSANPNGNVHVHDPESGDHTHSQLSSLDKKEKDYDPEQNVVDENEVEALFKKQIAAFLMLEFGVIFHSVVIGLNLGSAGYDDFKTLYIVLVFHQSFEGLGIGARLSAIEWPKGRNEWIRYALCIAYGLVTPISIAIGIGVRTSYSDSGFTSTLVSGVLDSLSAGILIYTGLIELLARDFIFNEEIKDDLPKLAFNIFMTLLGCFLMALLGKWA